MAGNKDNHQARPLAYPPSRGPNPNTSQLDDGTSSTASFEDVGVTKTTPETKVSTIIKDMIIQDPRFGSSAAAAKTSEGEEVPDVRYVLQYRDVSGNIVETRESDKPFDITPDAAEKEDSPAKKPVIEILTTVSATAKRNRNRYRNRRGGYYSPEYSESECSDSEDDVVVPDVKVRKVERTEMVIHSRHLVNALNAVVGHYPGANFYGDTVHVEAPYQVLVHHRDQLARYRIAQPACHDAEYAATTARHIGVLLGFLDRTYGDKIRAEEARHRNNPPAATFDGFWLLVKPGEVIYTKVQNTWTPFLISGVEFVRDSSQKIASYTIQCWNIRFGCGRMRRGMNSFSIRAFSGEQAIHTLEVVPAAFFPENLEEQGGVTMAVKQIALGKLYWDLVQKPAYREYDGQLVDRNNGLMVGNLSGRVIVDADGFERFGNMGPDGHGRRGMPPPPMPGRNSQPPPRDQLPQFPPRCSCKACSREDRDGTGPFAGFEDLDPRTDKPPQNDVYFLVCSTDVPAFVLSERRWANVSLDQLKYVKCDREAFKYLVLDDGIKLTVKALIGKFASADGKVSPWPHDFVKNKGEGRIFLLHGSPGVGKTCTAECVAELTHRPLLALTSGDISTSMSSASVERNLHYFLQLGERYGALVLLDEADVYLEERRTQDLRRNGLVSIFLRALEYYRGVLFLTTNRVEAFDSAFTSRIHVALHYRRLTDADRARIWANNFDRLERDSGGKVFVAGSARDYALGLGDRGGERERAGRGGDEVGELRWNGREIRNALQTAVALAETEALEDGLDRVAVGERHLRQVVRMSKGFKDFLRKRRGYDDDDGEDSDDEGDDDTDAGSCASRGF